MYYIVYRITNTLSSKQYIGVHKTPNLDDGYMGSGLLIKRAIEKYGIENFSKEILFQAESAEEMFDKERELIELHNPEYNLHEGGKGGWNYVNETSTSLQKREAGRLGGIKTTSKTGKEREIYIEKMRNSVLRSRDKISGKNKGKQFFLGKTHTEETKRKIGEANSKRMKGTGNSQYGTMWITNGSENMKIRKEWPIPRNWKRGRSL